MNTSEFKVFARGDDFKRVVVTCEQDLHMCVSALMRCDDELDDLTTYNYLRDPEGEIVKFDSTDEALTLIHMFGYRGKIAVICACVKAA
ncbi:MAG: hypothetical protein ACREO1_11865 [Arenimonas sp.]